MTNIKKYSKELEKYLEPRVTEGVFIGYKNKNVPKSVLDFVFDLGIINQDIYFNVQKFIPNITNDYVEHYPTQQVEGINYNEYIYGFTSYIHPFKLFSYEEFYRKKVFKIPINRGGPFVINRNYTSNLCWRQTYDSLFTTFIKNSQMFLFRYNFENKIMEEIKIYKNNKLGCFHVSKTEPISEKSNLMTYILGVLATVSKGDIDIAKQFSKNIIAVVTKKISKEEKGFLSFCKTVSTLSKADKKKKKKKDKSYGGIFNTNMMPDFDGGSPETILSELRLRREQIDNERN